ncbi:MAG: type I-C CRISPR-associated protein Cas5 [Calditrichaeota bacterium]|nr:type I-C CRISPR-associated protein Cas5 [Calditrichota bacterium]
MALQNFDPFCLEVWGDYACFTRPEMKVERVSYDVPTPSAVRAVFESIFWKPAIRWHVNKIEVLNPIKWVSVRRNEVGNVISERSNGLFIEDHRQQRAGLFLKDVRYRFYATMEFIPIEKRQHLKFRSLPGFLWDSEEKAFMDKEIKLFEDGLDRTKNGETPGKYLAMFERRAKKGQCFNQPYLGCREFSCAFSFVKNPEEEPLKSIAETRDLGFMLYDMDFSNPDNPEPMFFRAELKNGVVMVPQFDNEEVRR